MITIIPNQPPLIASLYTANPHSSFVSPLTPPFRRRRRHFQLRASSLVLPLLPFPADQVNLICFPVSIRVFRLLISEACELFCIFGMFLRRLSLFSKLIELIDRLFGFGNCVNVHVCAWMHVCCWKLLCIYPLLRGRCRSVRTLNVDR